MSGIAGSTITSTMRVQGSDQSARQCQRPQRDDAISYEE